MVVDVVMLILKLFSICRKDINFFCNIEFMSVIIKEISA